MFAAMMHAQNKWTGDAARTTPTVVQPATFSSGGVESLDYSPFRILHLRQTLSIDSPSNIVPTGYTWSVVTVVYETNFNSLTVNSTLATASTTEFITKFWLGVERPKDCIVKCVVTTSDKVYEIPYVIRWRSEIQEVVATITNGINAPVVNATNTIFTQQPTIQIVGSTITTWSWSVLMASWPSYTASSISISNATTPTPTFAATVPTSELPAYYAIACVVTYIRAGYNKSNQVISIVHVN
jgi:hypothetical protein